MENNTLLFVYKNSKNIISARLVTGVEDDGDYFDGLCETSREYKTFRKDRVLDYAQTPEQLMERYEYHLKITPAINGAPLKRRNRDHQGEIVFTGFSRKRKSELIEIAKSIGFYVPSGVTVNLDLLCAGEKAGPKKLEKAQKQGTAVITEEQFVRLLESESDENNS